MGDYKYIDVTINNLFPDTENFRFDPVKDVNMAINTMISQQPTKIYNLVKSILENGSIDPSILPNVVPYDKKSKCYVVMEGNRRITALKIIKDLSIIKDTNQHDRFAKLLSKYDLTRIPESVHCILYQNKEDSYFWTYLRHAGELNGEGLVSWNSLAVDRFRIATKQAEPNISYYIINYLKNKDLLKMDDFRFATTLKRIVDSSVGRDYYGLTIKDNKLTFEKSEDDTIKKILILIEHLIEKSITSRNTNTNADIQNWINRLDKLYLSTNPKRDKSSQDTASNFKQNENNHENFHAQETKSPTVPDNAQKNSSTLENQKNNHEVWNPGEKAIPKRFLEDLAFNHLDHTKYNGIINLGNELLKMSKAPSNNYITYPISSAMLLRSLVEQAFKYFLNKNGYWDDLCSKNKNEDPAFSQILTYCRNNRKRLFTDTTQFRLFGILFDDDSTIKDCLDLNIHHPNIVRITSTELKMFSNLGISSFINLLLK